MEDITLCGGDSCPLKQNCYRYTAEFFGRQDFFGSLPFDFTANECAHFLTNIEQVRIQAYYIWKEKGSPEGQAEAIWAETESKIIKS